MIHDLPLEVWPAGGLVLLRDGATGHYVPGPDHIVIQIVKTYLNLFIVIS